MKLPPNLFTPPGSQRVDLWWVELDQVAGSIPGWQDWLSSDERLKASRIRRPEIARRTAICRAVLRALLARRLGISPEKVVFSYNRFGKPSVDAAVNDSRFTFSVSHSGQLALIGISEGIPLGVDTEYTRRQGGIADAVSEICSSDELDRINGFAEDERAAEMYRYWTLKEAYLKALGVGLSHSPRLVEVLGRAEGADAQFRSYFLRVRGAWTTLIVESPSDYVAAIACAAPDMVPRLRWFGRSGD